VSDPRRFNWYRQRKKRGFDDRELWSLDHTIAKFTLPRLIAFKEGRFGYPGNLTEEKWDNILDQIIWSMQAIIDEWEGGLEDIRDIRTHEKKINKGINLFGKYFRHLWW